MKLILGNKNYSSWSIRPWLLMTYFDIKFDEKIIKLFTPEMLTEMHGDCPANKVPALIDGDIHVWDSLAICEYINENYIDGKGWPSDIKQKTKARSVVCEMHSGFFGIRNELPMNLRCPVTIVKNEQLSEQALNDIKRICDIWFECLTHNHNKNGFLFSEFSIADAMFFPVVSRFQTYAITVTASQKTVINQYMNQMLNLPAFLQWKESALKEVEVIDADER
ncbi:MAG: glutathione S-transferase family protein [Saccharospirillaceae bacterium]|nr:glutathione S-transferase family protein [Pseudomonadales bacterium]NRB77562.1 glutathione S-transferase family protein [Saccharospirillaceae bacterium]